MSKLEREVMTWLFTHVSALPALIGRESAQGLVLQFPFSVLVYQDRLTVNTL
jgi:hypothetical protein